MMESHMTGEIHDAGGLAFSDPRLTPKFTIVKRGVNSIIKQTPSNESARSTFERQFSNIFNEEDVGGFAANHEEDLNVEYFCVFCEDRFKDKDEARRHYQKHINYKPFICSLCGEGTTDLNEFLKHHTDVHPDAEKGRYKRREQPHIDKWINGFLYAQATIIRALPPREICPVCDKVFSQDQIIAARPRRCTVNRKIDHVHRHLCYLPYECLRCKAEGKEFLVAYFESKAHSHIKLKHPEVDDTESRWNLFQKTHAIPKLDEWIGEFLRRYGISMDFERRPVKKTMRDPGCADGSGVSDSLSVSGQHLAVLSSEHDSYDDSDSMVASEHGDEMIVAVAPHNTEAWLSMEDASNAFRLRPEYFCVFCPTKFTDKSEAYPHYGAHLDYRPISCTYCKISFHGMRPFTLHHQNTHPEFDLKYGVKEDHDIERWVDGFLESQRKVNVRRLTMNCSCGACCKVCSHFVGQRAASASPCASHSEVLFSDHAHRHLEYFPYECAICMITGKSTRVPNLDSFAVEHLRVEHKVKNSSVAQLARSFPKTLTIPVLERYIEDSLQKKRAIERKRVASVVANRQIALPAPAMSRVIKDGNRMIVEHPLLLRANKIDRSKLPPPTPPQASAFHIRVEDGRVVNLPSPPPPRRSSVKQSSRPVTSIRPMTDLIKRPAKTQMAHRNRLPEQRASASCVMCLHCNLELPNRKMLSTHHDAKHRGLSIACFTMPRYLMSAPRTQ